MIYNLSIRLISSRKFPQVTPQRAFSESSTGFRSQQFKGVFGMLARRLNPDFLFSHHRPRNDDIHGITEETA
jgi:hypothetical protein